MKYMFSVLALVLLISCGGSDKIAKPDSDEVDVYFPTWWGETDDNHYTAYAVGDSKDQMFALNKAKSTAINDISMQMNVRTKGLMKQFMEETGLSEEADLMKTATQVFKQTTSSVINGLRVDEQKLRKNKKTKLYTAYVKVSVPKGELANELLDKMKRKKHLYTKFQASKAFKELDAEVKEFDKKQEQY